jgi:hypothetical protein
MESKWAAHTGKEMSENVRAAKYFPQLKRCDAARDLILVLLIFIFTISQDMQNMAGPRVCAPPEGTATPSAPAARQRVHPGASGRGAMSNTQ